jgi:L-amino acid N-acyltransferase YncA
MDKPHIEPATPDDFQAMWSFFGPITRDYDSFCMPDTLDFETAKTIWFSKNHQIFKLVLGEVIIGTIMLRTNFGGLGRHQVANATFMIDPAHHGQGYGRQIGQFALDEARRQGYTAMLFNSVVSTNTRAVNLWQSLGFIIIGTVPRAYRHHTQGWVDTHIMHRFL